MRYDYLSWRLHIIWAELNQMGAWICFSIMYNFLSLWWKVTKLYQKEVSKENERGKVKLLFHTIWIVHMISLLFNMQHCHPWLYFTSHVPFNRALRCVVRASGIAYCKLDVWLHPLLWLWGQIIDIWLAVLINSHMFNHHNKLQWKHRIRRTLGERLVLVSSS